MSASRPSPEHEVTSPETTRIIAHLDLDAFYAAVEQLDNPHLRGKPVLVGGRSNRGVVTTASYEARRFGIHSGMPTYQALRRCPRAIVVPARFSRYGECSRRVMDLARQAATVVEQVSIDEAFIDLTGEVGCWQEGVERAARVQAAIHSEVELSVSVGVATNKLVAKVACDRDKPGGLTVVPPGEEAEFLAPLSVRVLWGVGPVMAGRLDALGIRTVGDLQQQSRQELWKHVGKTAAWLLRESRGQDRRPVSSARERRSVSRERTFSHDIVREQDLLDEIRSLSSGLERRLGRANLGAGTIALKVRYSDFTTLTRQMRMTVPATDWESIYLAGAALLRRGWQVERPVRLLGVIARDLCRTPEQPRLLDTCPSESATPEGALPE